jgi:hypothetical protein
MRIPASPHSKPFRARSFGALTCKGKDHMEARISLRAVWFALKGRHQAVQEWNSDMVGNPAYVRFALRQRRVIWVL